MSTPKSPGMPSRYVTSRGTLFVDKAMTWFIEGGGLAVIIAVFGIFVFILWQVLPLFQSASVNRTDTVTLPKEVNPTEVIGVLSDEWGELPMLVERDGTATFIPVPQRRNSGGHDVTLANSNAEKSVKPALAAMAKVIDLQLSGPGEKTSVSFCSVDHRRQRVIIGTSDGRFAVRTVKYKSNFIEGSRQVTGVIENDLTLTLGEPGKAIMSASYGDGGERKLAAVIQQVGDQRRVLAATLVQARTLLGAGETKADRTFDLSDKIVGVPEKLLVDERAEGIIVVTKAGDLQYFFLNDDGFELRQSFKPFGDQPEPHLASIDFLLPAFHLN